MRTIVIRITHLYIIIIIFFFFSSPIWRIYYLPTLCVSKLYNAHIIDLKWNTHSVQCTARILTKETERETFVCRFKHEFMIIVSCRSYNMLRRVHIFFILLSHLLLSKIWIYVCVCKRYKLLLLLVRLVCVNAISFTKYVCFVYHSCYGFFLRESNHHCIHCAYSI